VAHLCTAAAVEGKTVERPEFELADVFRLHGLAYRQRHALPLQHLSVMRMIEKCRTAALGGHLERCELCGYQAPRYNSCRNRHCPKCQAIARRRWLAARERELLPVGYFHLVFTLPHELNPVILSNKETLLGLLFATVNETLQAFAHDPQWRLQGQLGVLAILHTWSQTLIDHFHLHCLVPAGVICQGVWKEGRADFLFRTKSLAKDFRRRYLQALSAIYDAGSLLLVGRCQCLQNDQRFAVLLQELGRKKWIVYAKAPFAGPLQVLRYLGRYTHRVAISNSRILAVTDSKVTFAYRDRSDADKRKLMSLDPEEFIRRFLLHVLPRGFMKIRYYGFLANRCRAANLSLIRSQQGSAQHSLEPSAQMILTPTDFTRCPSCHEGVLVRLPLPSPLFPKEVFNTS